MSACIRPILHQTHTSRVSLHQAHTALDHTARVSLHQAHTASDPYFPCQTASDHTARVSLHQAQDCKTRSLGAPPPPLNSSPGKKNCTGFPFQNVLNINVLNIKSLVRVSMLSMVLVLLTFLNSYMSTLRLVLYPLLLTPAC